MKKLNKDKRGVFGLTAVQSFFVIILGIALLAYVIIIIMGVLSTSNIIPQTSSTIVNESITIDGVTGTNLATNSLSGGTCGTVTKVYIANGTIISAGNYTQTGCLLINTTTEAKYSLGWLVTYPATYDAAGTINSKAITLNVSSGVTGFFSAINPVYAILAVLVIILVLIVLVRVVQGGGNSRRENSTQL